MFQIATTGIVSGTCAQDTGQCTNTGDPCFLDSECTPDVRTEFTTGDNYAAGELTIDGSPQSGWDATFKTFVR